MVEEGGNTSIEKIGNTDIKILFNEKNSKKMLDDEEIQRLFNK